MGLTAKRVEWLLKKGECGRHSDGDGLYLEIDSPTNAHWSRRYQLDGRERWYGLGSLRAFSLSEARERNRKVSQLLADGIDPIERKREAKAARTAKAAKAITFGECAEAFFKLNSPNWKSAKHVSQWSTTVLGRTPSGNASKRGDVCMALRPLPVTAIDTPLLIQVLQPIWHEKGATAVRTRQRIEAILDYAIASEFRTGPNPAQWATLGKVLPSTSKRAKHFAAMPYAELPGFMASLRAREGTAARGLEFAILTAARSNEVLGARWPEINLTERVWIVPPERMKGGKEHRVPLSAPAIKLLGDVYREDGNDFVFIGSREGRGIGDNTALLQVLRSLSRTETVHGFRSAFSDWAHERSSATTHVIELSLAHDIGNAAEKAYRRTDLFHRRRLLMEQWAAYCTSPLPVESRAANVVAIGGAR
jgi:integrase